MLRMEREIIGHMEEGNRRGYNDPMLVPADIRIEIENRHSELNAGQRQAVEDIFLSREKIIGLEGIAGASKTCLITGWHMSRFRVALSTPRSLPTTKANWQMA
jgi:hypothetical protein